MITNGITVVFSNHKLEIVTELSYTVVMKYLHNLMQEKFSMEITRQNNTFYLVVETFLGSKTTFFLTDKEMQNILLALSTNYGGVKITLERD